MDQSTLTVRLQAPSVPSRGLRRRDTPIPQGPPDDIRAAGLLVGPGGAGSGQSWAVYTGFQAFSVDYGWIIHLRRSLRPGIPVFGESLGTEEFGLNSRPDGSGTGREVHLPAVQRR